MSYKVSKIATVINAGYLQHGTDALIENLLTDSRKLLFAESTLFFALPGVGRSGNSFIKSLHQKSVSNFVIDDSFNVNELQFYPNTTFLLVKNVLAALQELVAFHRHNYAYPVIGITGSNGKTIVKEWLNQLLGDTFTIVKNLKSYNSQTGVPLSVWRMNNTHTLGIFESGISTVGEMEQLQKIIDPQIGIVTFIGSAHAEGFQSIQQKTAEKLLLFTNSKVLIFNEDDVLLTKEVQQFIQHKNKALTVFTWSKVNTNHLFVKHIQNNKTHTNISCIYKNNSFTFSIPFTDEASIHNAITCCCTMLYLNISVSDIAAKMSKLLNLEMRLELKQGINNTSVINDGYSADIQSLSIALDFLLQQNQHEKRTVILSDVLQTGKEATALYSKIALLLTQKKVDQLIGIGTTISANTNLFKTVKQVSFYNDTASFLQKIWQHHFNNEAILLKGARVFQFEKISSALEQKMHETKLEINLNALRHNLAVYRKLLSPGVKIMAMVKAFSYGSGSFEIASVLQHTGIEYLAVAYADEAVDLRNAGITLPVMVMNCEPAGFENLVKYSLEPELYSMKILNDFIAFLKSKNIQHFPVHLKIDTGMHRLGFDAIDIDTLNAILLANDAIKIISVFSHLAGSDAADHDNFTANQIALFKQAADKIESAIGYTFIRHIANSSAIFRHPNAQLNMVRLGIGMYGLDASENIQQQLQPVTTLKTTISQIKYIAKGESIGYSRKGIAAQNITTATVRIGYADGYPRVLSNGKGKMLINGKLAPVIGNICMDMTMLNITDIDANEGDEVIVFGDTLPVNDVAHWAETISYEILTNISQRVKRIYYEE